MQIYIQLKVYLLKLAHGVHEVYFGTIEVVFFAANTNIGFLFF